MTTINEYKNCVGCYTNTEHKTSIGLVAICSVKSFNLKGECPCVRCIIKMVCHDSCDDFFNFITAEKEYD